jgi:hypothetical protein
MQENNINFDNWFLVFGHADFGFPSFGNELGWYDDRILPDDFSSKERKDKLEPELIYLYATLNTNFEKENLLYKMSESPDEIKQLFLKFFSKDLSTILLNMSIVATPEYYDYKGFREHFIYSLENYSFVPKNPNGYLCYYEFLFPDFWIKNKIYRSYKFNTTRESNTNKYSKYSPFENQREAIFSAIWESYCSFETRLTITQPTFIKIIFTLLNLAEDTLVKPIHKINDIYFLHRKSLFSAYQYSENYSHFGMNPERWNKKVPSDKVKIFILRLLDSKEYLNSFFKKYNYSTMNNALELFLIKMFESFADALVNNRILTKCAFCGEYFQFKKGKKYCSPLNEKKDCAKSSANKRYYSVKGKERLPKYRQTNKELRDFYKEMGIKK